ncbi:hypothetical protein BKA80DRAFT_266865 [Phyllosticta citrichinensis]
MIYRLTVVALGLLKVNRSVYNESLPVLYSRGKFLFSFITQHDAAGETCQVTETFVKQIGAPAAYIKRNVVASHPGMEGPPTLIHLEKLYM